MTDLPHGFCSASKATAHQVATLYVILFACHGRVVAANCKKHRVELLNVSKEDAMSVIVDLSVFPISGEKSLSPYVARVIRVIEESGLAYALGPMGTAIEGDWEDILQVVDACYRELEPDFDRIYMNMKVDAKRGRTDGIRGKVESVLDKSE